MRLEAASTRSRAAARGPGGRGVPAGSLDEPVQPSINCRRTSARRATTSQIRIPDSPRRRSGRRRGTSRGPAFVPGVCETRATVTPRRAFRRLDFPTFDRPRTASAGRAFFGHSPGPCAARTRRTSAPDASTPFPPPVLEPARDLAEDNVVVIGKRRNPRGGEGEKIFLEGKRGGTAPRSELIRSSRFAGRGYQEEPGETGFPCPWQLTAASSFPSVRAGPSGPSAREIPRA